MEKYEKVNKKFGPFWLDELEIKIDRTSSLPAWIQIASIIAGQVSRRRIKAGEYVGSIREVAQHNSKHPRSVAKAYNILVQQGFIESDPKRGFVVGAQILERQNQLLQTQLLNLKIMALQMEMEKTELLEAVSKIWLN